MTIVPGVITFLLYYEQLKTMIIQNLGDGNSNKQTGQHLKHFALFNLMNIHLNQMTLSLISLISCLKLLIRQYQNPRSVLNQENLGLMMNVNRQ